MSSRNFGGFYVFPQIIREDDAEIMIYCLGVVLDRDQNDKDFVYMMPTHWAKQTNDIVWQRTQDFHIYRCIEALLISVVLPSEIALPPEYGLPEA